MIKRTLLTALLILATFLASFAGNVETDVTLSNDKKNWSKEFNYCNIFVSLTNINDNNATITIELKHNDNNDKTLILFQEAYNEKKLKRQNPSIKYDKIFAGDGNRDRTVDACKDLQSLTLISPNDEKKKLLEMTKPVKDQIKCTLPIYIAKEKKKKWWQIFGKDKMLLSEKGEITLVIKIQVQQDTVYIAIEDSCNALINEINSETFCTNTNHPKGKSIESLKKKYEGKINNLKQRIDSVAKYKYRDYFSSDDPYKKLKGLLTKLDSISLDSIKKVDSCSDDRKPKINKPKSNKHSCNYCSKTDSALLALIHKYYNRLYRKKKIKAQVMPDVESIYTCLSKNTERKVDKKTKKEIVKYYNTIKSWQN